MFHTIIYGVGDSGPTSCLVNSAATSARKKFRVCPSSASSSEEEDLHYTVEGGSEDDVVQVADLEEYGDEA